jgi:DNA-binding PadR family transcriptional regulator
MATKDPSDALPAHWFHILLALADEPRHGLGITEEAASRSGGQAQLWPGMLYIALRRMTAAGLIVETEPPADFNAGGGRPRFYRLTPAGRRALSAEAERLARLVDAARAKRVIKRAKPV